MHFQYSPQIALCCTAASSASSSISETRSSADETSVCWRNCQFWRSSLCEPWQRLALSECLWPPVLGHLHLLHPIVGLSCVALIGQKSLSRFSRNCPTGVHRPLNVTPELWRQEHDLCDETGMVPVGDDLYVKLKTHVKMLWLRLTPGPCGCPNALCCKAA